MDLRCHPKHFIIYNTIAEVPGVARQFEEKKLKKKFNLKKIDVLDYITLFCHPIWSSRLASSIANIFHERRALLYR